MADRGDRRDLLEALAGGAWLNGGIVDGPWAYLLADKPEPRASLSSLGHDVSGTGSPGATTFAPGGSVPSGPGRRIVFIDGSVADAKTLAGAVQDGVLAVILSPDSDELDQIVAWLAAHASHDLATIALVADGANGMVRLGTSWLSDATLDGYRDQLYAIGKALGPDGDIQLYACDVAQDAAGLSFVGRLSAEADGVPVSASSHLIGAADLGGSFQLDVNTGTGQSAAPFTVAAEAAFNGLLGAGQAQLFLTPSNLTNTGAAAAQLSAEFDVLSGGTSVVSNTTLAIGTQSPAPFTGVRMNAIAVDPATGVYYLNNSNGNVANRLLEGTIASPGGTLTTIQAQPLSFVAGASTALYQMDDLKFDQASGNLYYTTILGAFTSNATLVGDIGVWKVGTAVNATPTQVIGGAAAVSHGGALTNGFTATSTVSTITSIPRLTNLALDLADNAIFVVNQGLGSVPSTLMVGNVLTGKVSALITNGIGTTINDVSFANGTIYWDITNTATTSLEGIFSAAVTVTNPGSTQVVSIGGVNTLYSGTALNGIGQDGLAVDPGAGLIYWANKPSPGTTNSMFINVGTITGGTASAVMRTIITAGTTNLSGFSSDSLVIETVPTVAASGTVAYAASGTAVAIAPSAAVTNADGSFIVGGSVVISSGFLAGDTLTATTSGSSIAASFSGGTLSLSGADTAAHYQAVIDSIKYSSSASNPRNGGANPTRSLTYTINDGLISSTSPVTTVTITPVAPTIVAGATVSFTGGSGTTTVLDSGLTLTDPDSTNQVGATISIGNFLSGDLLNFTNQNGIVGSYSAGTGTLVLSGTASVANYQTALESISFSFNPANGDPTSGNTKTSRTISWISNDGAVNSTSKTSVLNVVHVAPTIVAAGTVTYGGGAGAVVLAPAATVTAPDSAGLLSSATIAVTGGTFASDGDLLAATTAGTSITALYNSATYTLTLTGSDTTAHYQTVLRSVTINTSGSDPTNGGANPSRSISWTVNDGVLSSPVATTTATGTLCFLEHTLIRTPNGEAPVERLTAGDRVITWSGEIRPITWIGTGRVLATRGRRSAATPVIVQAGAIADGVPNKDLRVTKGHAFWLDGVLIPVEFLVNHRTILWDDHAQEVKLYHVELDRHDVLVANGAPAESYRDDGNRWLFRNANDGWDLPPLDHYASVLTGGPVVDAVWRRLLNRAGPRRPVPMTDDAGLHLVAGGRRIDPVAVHGQTHVFELTQPAGPVRLVSRASVPAELGFARDFRALGVPVAGIAARSLGRSNVLEAPDERLSDGFHEYETEANIRWTNGDAALPESLFLGCHGPTRVIVTLRGATTYVLLDEEGARAAA